MEDAIRIRRARRVFSERYIDDEEARPLIEAVRLSASCFNNQPWRLVFCRGQDSIESVKLCLAKGNAWATRAPMIIVVAARSSDDCDLSDRRSYSLFDCGLAIGQLQLRAAELGLIAHPIAGYDPVRVKLALNIPEEYIVVTLVICGYPGSDDSMLSEKQKAAEQERPARKPEGENIFIDRWGRPFAD